MCQKLRCPNLKYHSGKCPEGLRTTTKNLSQVSWQPHRDSRRVLPEFKSEALPLS
jgi:hypothetical protein